MNVKYWNIKDRNKADLKLIIDYNELHNKVLVLLRMWLRKSINKIIYNYNHLLIWEFLIWIQKKKSSANEYWEKILEYV